MHVIMHNHVPSYGDVKVVNSEPPIIFDRTLNDVRFQYAFAKYEVSPPYSHGDWQPGDFTARLPFCTPVFSYRGSTDLTFAMRERISSSNSIPRDES